jgi:hypothetical protein
LRAAIARPSFFCGWPLRVRGFCGDWRRGERRDEGIAPYMRTANGRPYISILFGLILRIFTDFSGLFFYLCIIFDKVYGFI